MKSWLTRKFCWEAEEDKNFCLSLHKTKEGTYENITNPNSIYISGTFNFKGYKKFKVHCYIDTGSSLCLASKNIIPEEYWENAPKTIKAQIANGKDISINKVCRNLSIEFAGETFKFPTIYQQDSGMDMIVGNNFIQYYGPFIQWPDRIAFHLKDEMIVIGKTMRALQVGKTGFIP